MGIRHAKSVDYVSRSNGWAEVAGKQLLERLCKIQLTHKRHNPRPITTPPLQLGCRLNRFYSEKTPWDGDFPCQVMARLCMLSSFLRGKTLLRGRPASSSGNNMPCEPRPPRGQHCRNLRRVTRYGY